MNYMKKYNTDTLDYKTAKAKWKLDKSKNNNTDK